MKSSNSDEYVGKALLKVIDAVTHGKFGNKQELTELMNSFRNKNDHYLVCADFTSYCQANELVFKNIKIHVYIHYFFRLTKLI